MAIKHLGNGRLTGLAADTKPTTYPAGATFQETDSISTIQSHWDGTNWNLIPNYIDIARSRIGFIEDFIGVVASAGGYGGIFSDEASGTGAVCTVTLTNTNNNQFGIGSCQTGTTTTGRAGQRGGSFNTLLVGQGRIMYETSVRFPVLSDGTETYSARFGLIDSVSGDAVDGVYFEYDQTTSANWRCCTSNNSVRTKNTSAVAVDTNFNRLTIIVNAAGTSASFYLNGTELTGSAASPITTNFPTGAGRQTGVAHAIVKSLGGTSRLMDMDYVAFQMDLTTRR